MMHDLRQCATQHEASMQSVPGRGMQSVKRFVLNILVFRLAS